MELFKLLGKIVIDNDNANKGIDETGGKAEKAYAKLKSAFTSMGNVAVRAGKTIATGLGAGITAMGALVTKSVNLAGELEQNMGGSEAVFGKFAKTMQNTAAQAYKTMGLSQSDYLATANKMGSLFKGAGFDVEQSSKLTQDAMQRAADVASIMGISTESAMESIAGAAKGNFTMMDNLGVAINDTTLAQYALTQGITKSTSEMTTQEKVGLAMQLFMEKTADYAGNYSKENETLAGSLSTAKAALTNFLSGAGDVDALADAFVNAGNVIIKNVKTLAPKLIKGLNQLITKLLPYIPEMIQEILPSLIEGAVLLMTALATALPDIVKVLGEQLPYIMQQLGAALTAIAPLLLQAIIGLIESIDFSKVGEFFGNLITSLFGDIPAIFSALGSVISFAWEKILYPLLQGLFKAVFGIDLPPWEEVWASIQTWWSDVKSAFGNFFSALFTIETTDKDGNNKPWYKVIADWFVGVMSSLGGALLAVFGVKPEDVEDVVKEITEGWEKVKAEIGKLVLTTTVTGSVVGTPENQDRNRYLGQIWDMAYGEKDGSHATGLDFVPRDNYVANLHQGEAVLTRDEASAWRAGAGGGVADNGALLNAINNLTQYMQQMVANTAAGNTVVLDSGAIVGQLAPAIDLQLGNINARKARRG